MKPKIILCLALGLAISFGQSFASDASAVNVPAPGSIHDWQYIMYPMLAKDGWVPGDPFFTVGYAEKTQGLRLDIDGLPSDFFKTHKITARLHRANAEVVDPTPEGKQMLNAPMSIQTASRPGDTAPDCQVMTFFPWGPNTMGESWIEVSMGAERYWVEIPYGFDRDPHDLLPPPTPGGPPKMAPAMKHLTSHDRLVRWLTVHYDLSRIQNGWSLTLTQSKSGDGQSEAVVDCLTDTPHISLRILDLLGLVVGVGTVFADSQLPHDDGQTRDAFLLGRNRDDLRCWGLIMVSVNDNDYCIIVPSSLYKYRHGHAESQ